MIQHHNCPYCGKALNGVLACKCEESQLKWMSPKEFKDKLIGVLPRHQKCKLEYIQIPQKTMLHNEIKPIYKSDLLSVARELPKIPNIDHEKLILDSYCEGNWKAVDLYIDFVHQLSKEIGITKPNKTRKQIITEKISNCTTKAISWLKSHLNNLNQAI